MAKKSIVELKKIVEEQIVDRKHTIEIFTGEKNPQIVDMYNTAKNELTMLEAVLHYCITGSKLYF